MSSPALLNATNVRLRLLDAGYSPVAATGKCPQIRGYTGFADSPPAEATVTGWGTNRPKALNTGIVCGGTRVIDLDVDDPVAAQEAKAAIYDALGGAAPPCRGGRGSRVALFMRSTQSGHRTKQHKFPRGGIEFRGHGAHVVVDGIHPDTGKPYYWMNEPIWEVLQPQLPVITADAETEILLAVTHILGGAVQSRPMASASTNTMVAEGGRNNFLFRKIKDAAAVCDTEQHLIETANGLNRKHCEPPLPTNEILKIVRQVWDWKQQGKLLSKGSQATAFISEAEHKALTPNACHLLAGLRIAHGACPGKLFALVGKAMGEKFKMSAKRIRKARNELLRLGILEKVGPTGRKGHPTQYRLVL